MSRFKFWAWIIRLVDTGSSWSAWLAARALAIDSFFGHHWTDGIPVPCFGSDPTLLVTQCLLSASERWVFFYEIAVAPSLCLFFIPVWRSVGIWGSFARLDGSRHFRLNEICPPGTYRSAVGSATCYVLAVADLPSPLTDQAEYALI